MTMTNPTGDALASTRTGRPLEFKDSFSEEIINLMASGLSLTAAAASLGFHRDTIYDWAKKNPIFSDALKLARGKRVLHLEKELLDAAEGPRVTARIFALKNADPTEWREKVDHEMTGKDGGAIQTENISDPRQLARAIAVFLAEAGG